LRTVSGTVSLPSRGTFHLSLTVLVRYRSSGSIQAYQVVLADSHGISRAPYYLGSHHGTAESIAATGLTPPVVRPSNRFAYAPAPRPTSPAELVWMVPRPRPCNARRLSHMTRFSLIRVRSPLLTESLLFSLPAGTEMFHFPAFPPRTLCVQIRVTR